MKTDGSLIADNLRVVREKIARSAERSGRSPETVRLIAVSKTKPIELIKEAFEAGQTLFGENYVQEAVAKKAEFPEATWHFIGSLQTNKAKQIVGRFPLIHSMDRRKLADEIEKIATASGLVQDVLLQIHIGQEATKQGVGFAEAPELLEHVLGLPHIRLRGIMSLPPLTEDERVAREQFAKLRDHFELLRKQMPSEKAAVFTELSMGTSSDFEWAILEGATYVRVGTSIFGAREGH